MRAQDKCLCGEQTAHKLYFGYGCAAHVHSMQTPAFGGKIASPQWNRDLAREIARAARRGEIEKDGQLLLYTRCPRVIAESPEREGKMVGANCLVLELPGDAQMRQMVYPAVNTIVLQLGFALCLSNSNEKLRKQPPPTRSRQHDK